MVASSFVIDYLIGIACSIIVVIVTTFLQFKYEQRKVVSNVLSHIRFFYFHFLLYVMSLNPEEETSEKLLEHYNEVTYNDIKKVSEELSNLEWFSKKKISNTMELHKATLIIMMDLAKHSYGHEIYELVKITDSDYFKNLKDYAKTLSVNEEFSINRIEEDYEKIIQIVHQFLIDSEE